MSRSRPLRVAAAAATAALLSLTAACGSSSSGGSADAGNGGSSPAASADAPADAPSGDLLVLTNRTDLVDNVFEDYKKTFNEKYPDVKIKFEALTDYEGEVKTRMNTKDYGDVLLIPGSVTVADYPDFFEPLGTTDELGKKYRFINEAALDGTAYGIATFGNANGLVYNTDVFKQAGITALPTSPQEFIADLQAIKDKTDAVPLYTNYKDGWPLAWPEDFMGAQSGDPDAFVKLTESDTPWAAGQEKATMDSLMYDLAKAGLIEDDPTTTNWESSKNLIATGKIGAMGLGSWAVPQMQEAAEKAGKDKSVIGYMPPPFQVDGAFTSPIGGDFKIAINKNSSNKVAARAWIDWFIDDSGFYDYAGGLPTLKDKPAPKTLTEFEATGVKYLEMTFAPTLSSIDNEAEIGLRQPDYYRTLIDAGRGASKETKESIFKSLDKRWTDARKSVG